ncbi:hypothetical protein GIB67_026240 [Kingdonia uniflora]|uniref:BZIP domain-containing protein n=1 Tax=Kingdonia uniflora TaxID=39325 RepID=A0A7J7LA17_9MAGN|nr:hypothetical protein GIB67_026240 [Kingdonia uniflora]
MSNFRGSSNFKNMQYSGKQSLLPPKSPFPSIPSSYAEYGSNSSIGGKSIPKSREGHTYHQRTSSESFLLDEQHSWVEELLNEPDTPVRKGHRRSSSDSFAYLEAANANLHSLHQEDYKYRNFRSVLSRGSQDFENYKDLRQVPFYPELSSFRRQDRAWEPSLSSMNYPSDNILLQSSGSSCAPHEPDGVPSTASGKQDQEVSAPHDLKGSTDRKDCSLVKPSASDTDPKRAKQAFAQRSRVRKLQYIAELEKNVQALEAMYSVLICYLQTEGSEVSAELQFLDQQHLILNLENETLKRRLANLAQEHTIKYMEHEILEREVLRLRGLYQQQQQRQQPQQPSSHRRTSSRDLESRFANLALNQSETSS